MNSSSYEGDDHLTEVQIASYLDRTLTTPQRDRIEDHLANCPDCRRQMLETKELLERMRRPRKLLIGGTLAAAAAVVFLVLRPNADSGDQRALIRAGETATPLAAYGPINSVSRVGLRFVWSPAPGAESYRLTVNRSDGNSVWSSSGTDTLASLPDSVVLSPNERYFWVTDAVLSDGTTRSTGLREFRVVR